MKRSKKVLLPLLILVFILLAGFSSFAQENAGNISATQEEPYLLQEVDVNGNIVSSRTMSEQEFQMMKAVRVNKYSKETFVSGCNVNVTIFYHRYLDHGVYYFSPSTITYIFAPNPANLFHYNIVRQPYKCSGSITTDAGSGSYVFYP